MASLSEIRSQKSAIRAEAQRLRAAQPDKNALSRQICDSIAASAEFRAARVVLLYLTHRSEVRMPALFDEAFRQDKTVVVPYCVGDEIGLFRIEHMDEITAGAYSILEPRPGLRKLDERCVAPEELDLVVVPGMAYDRTGARIGRGKGSYDRLLAQLRPNTFLVAPAFECQVFDHVPTLEHDAPVDRVVTETNIYPQ
ncbi:MAG: 5-formyltetrahydrofolate cyclo-ligase [Pirellulales bacterium]|nr:5-formyltetrahydrofolate cyclo-ligase [Pirellulales bacterium]